jgi:hypothetical protein
MDCNDALRDTGTIIETLLPILGESVFFYNNRISVLNPKLVKKKDAMFVDAQTWNPITARRTIEDSRNFLDTLPKAQQVELYDRTELKKEKIPEAVRRQYNRIKDHVKTTVFSAAASAAVDTAAVAGLGIGAAINPLAESPANITNASLALAYSIWLASACNNSEENLRAIEKTGIGANIWAKLAHDLAVRNGVSEKVKALATHAAFAAKGVRNEGPLISSAVIFSDDLSQAVGQVANNSDISSLVTSKLFASAAHLIIAELTHKKTTGLK